MPHHKHSALKSTLARLGPHATTQQVIEELERYGIEVSKKVVIQAKAQMLRDEAQALREQAKRPPQNKSHKRPQQRKIPR